VTSPGAGPPPSSENNERGPGPAGGAGRPSFVALRGAVGFLTPLFGAAPPSPQALWWFPAVGAVLGLAVGTVWWVAGQWWPPLVAAAITVAADLALTGMLHADGLCDAADGLLPHLDRERRLAVMSEPGVGAFGMAVTAVVLLLRWSALASMHPAPLLVAALWAASRTWMSAAVVGVRYARADRPGAGDGPGSGGLASAFMSPDQGRQLAPLAIGGVGAALALALVWRPVVGPLAIAAGTVAAVGVVLLAIRRVGGFTGDVLGAAGIVGETVGLVVASARW
jgi:adenosylcobinamide-GDP ribazoletransferase